MYYLAILHESMTLHQAGHLQETHTSPSGNLSDEYRKEYLCVGLVGKGCQKGAMLKKGDKVCFPTTLE